MAQSREQKRLARKQQKSKIRAQQYAAAALRKKQKGHREVAERPVKVNGYTSTKLNARRNKLRDEAEKRDFAYSKLNLQDKIKLVKSRPGESKREIARLTTGK